MNADDTSRFVPGITAGLLFGAMALAFLNANFGEAAGFPEDVSVVHNIGYALFNIPLGEIPSEGFLAAFLIVAIALDIAIDGAIYLAKRQEEGTIVSAIGGGFMEQTRDPRTGGED